jgi:hypothetical protein
VNLLLKGRHGINSAYAGYFNREYGRVDHLFQGRYKAIVVDRALHCSDQDAREAGDGDEERQRIADDSSASYVLCQSLFHK